MMETAKVNKSGRRKGFLNCSMICTSVTIATNLSWLLIWGVLSLVDVDVKDDVNLHFTRELQLTQLIDLFGILRLFHLTLILVSFSVQLIYVSCTSMYSKYATSVVNGISITYNVGLFYYLINNGGIVWSLFLLAFPLLTVRFFFSNFYFILLLVIVWVFISWFKMRQSPRSKCSSKLIYSLLLVLLFVIATVVLMKLGCHSCSSQSLPTRPYLTAHRGCSSEAPENSVAAFLHAISVPSVITLESDVHLSQDGVLFLLHDETLFRTTSFTKKCSHLSPLTKASSLNYYTGSCPLKDLPLIGDLSQHIPTLGDLLSIAKKHKKNIIFDLSPPNKDHPYYSHYVDYTLQTVIQSGLDLNKVWWLEVLNRSFVSINYPKITIVAKTEFTSLGSFRRNNISIANEHWSTASATIRQLQLLKIAINLYTINSDILYEYAWCLGIESVTTDKCQQLNDHTHNYLYEACHSIILATPWLLALLIALLCISVIIM